jgi:hypothetical protein
MTQHSAGDVDYDANGQFYAGLRRTDSRIATLVHGALGRARTVLMSEPARERTSLTPGM